MVSATVWFVPDERDPAFAGHASALSSTARTPKKGAGWFFVTRLPACDISSSAFFR